jgi:hypothetical protein
MGGSQVGSIGGAPVQAAGGAPYGRAGEGTAGEFITPDEAGGATAAMPGSSATASGAPGDEPSAGAGAGEGPRSTCDLEALWRAILVGTVGIGECQAKAPPPSGDYFGQGAVVIDHEGRVIDNTGIKGDEKQKWLDSLGGMRWPCLADQTIGYICKAHE